MESGPELMFPDSCTVTLNWLRHYSRGTKQTYLSHPNSAGTYPIPRIVVSMRLGMLATIILLGLLVLSSTPAAAQRKLLVSASVSTENILQGRLISVTGFVKTQGNLPVENAEISIQVTNPQNGSVFVGLIFSGANGGYSIKFTLPIGAVPGNYSIFITVSKPGFERNILRLFFLISNPDFSLVVSPQSVRVKQGEEALFTVTVVGEGGFKSRVNLTLTDYPQGVLFKFSNVSLTPPGSAVLTLNTTRSTPAGAHNITVVGIGGGMSHSIRALLEVERASDLPTVIAEDYSTLFTAAAVVAVVLIGVAAVALLRRRRRPSDTLKALRNEARVDRGYVATARALAKLEELKALGQISEADYENLRKEFESRLHRDIR